MIALITGATSGIGKATAQEFAKNGYHLILTGRRADRLQTLKEELQKAFTIEVEILVFDVRNKEEVFKVLTALSEKWRNVDVLVNNAGLAAGLSTIQDGDLNDWEQMIDTNVKGLLYVSKVVMPWMITQKSGHIINIGSIAGKEVYPNGNVYCASKHAVDALTKGMRVDLLPHGIKVTSINPGMVETEFSIVRFKGDEERAKKVYEGLEALQAKDIADTAFWIASRPAHVNINEITIMPTAQASSQQSIRK